MAILRRIRSLKPRYFSIVLSLFFRSVGLELLNVLARRIFQKSVTEPKKFVIRKSRCLALARCGVQILPILFSIVLVVPNWNDSSSNFAFKALS